MNAEQLAHLFQQLYASLAPNMPPLDYSTLQAVCREILKDRVLLDRKDMRKGGIKYG